MGTGGLSLGANGATVYVTGRSTNGTDSPVGGTVAETAAAVLESGGVRLELSSSAALTGDAVLVAAGRQSNTANLGLEKAGVKTGERGIIPVNEHFQTNIKNIYAAGDVIGFPALASTSMEQARRAVRHALGLGGSAIFRCEEVIQ
jgi:NAD(P) transhydrogenase